MTTHFLIVDDEPAVCEMYATFLRILGYTATDAHSSQAARDRLLYERPDVILLDIMLPDTSGIELCRELRQHPATRDKTIIVVSAYAPPLIDEAMNAGADRYLVKPMKLATLKQTLTDMGL